MSTSFDFSDEDREAEIDGLPLLYLRGVRLFNDKDFFECHEVWEEMWRHSIAEYSRFYQGLIQAAVSFYHWGNANFDGAMRLANESLAKLEGLDNHFLKMELGTFRAQFTQLTKPLREREAGLKPLPASEVPQLLVEADWAAFDAFEAAGGPA